MNVVLCGNFPAGVGDPVTEAVGQAFDQTVEAQPAKLISDGALAERFWIAAGQSGKLMAQVGTAEALGELSEEDEGVQKRVHAPIGKAQS